MNKNTKKAASVVLAFALCSVFLSGCSEKTNSNSTQTNTQTSATEEFQAENIDPYLVNPSIPVNLDEEITDNMYNRALINEGNQARLKKAIKKAMNGESVTVGVIGGSITQGSCASQVGNCYASLFRNWWSDNFPESTLNFVNAGIGGTDSYLGVHRVDKQLLSSSPDVVIVEYSVNDTSSVMNKYSYDSLVRKILNFDTSPAVILLFTTQEDGTSLEDTHKEIGAAYNLPMLSYRQAVYPEVAAGTLNWKDISPDNIHPNDKGHEIIGQIISRYLDSVYANLDNISDDITFDTPSCTSDYYKNASLYSAADITASSIEGFEIGNNSVYSQFTDNWITAAGGTVTFDVECQNFGIFYLRTTDGKSGSFEVYIDGERKGKIEADFTGGWGNYGFTQQFIISTESAKHTIEIKPAEDSEDKALTILALMVS